jgi:hypothetical protein
VHLRKETQSGTNPSYSIVLMMNPKVGLTPSIGSPSNFLHIVVLPAASRPLKNEQTYLRILVSLASRTHSSRIRISLSLSRAFLNIDNILEVREENQWFVCASRIFRIVIFCGNQKLSLYSRLQLTWYQGRELAQRYHH